jgi:hypothetical protein
MWFGQSPSAAGERGGPLPSVDVADALLARIDELLDERSPTMVLNVTVGPA